MATNTEHLFNTLAQSRITEAITASDTSLTLIPGGALDFLPGWISGKEFYCTLVDASANREIIKVTDISYHTFTIERGQDGSSTRAWPTGTIVVQRCVAANFTRFMQKLDFRTINYDPNGVLTAAYPGEKVYDAGVGNCQTWWKHITGTVWALIGGTEVLRDTYFDDACYKPDLYSGSGWDDPNQQWLMAVTGADELHRQLAAWEFDWVDDYRPDSIKVTYTYDNALIGIYVKDGDGTIIGGSIVDNSYVSDTELALTFGSKDINAIWFNLGTPANSVAITNIQYATCGV